MSKKFFSVFVTTATLVAMLGVAPAARAATAEELQAQINSLLQTIAALQAQLGTPSSGSMSSGYTYTRNLTVGATGTDVQMLQKFLNANGYAVSASGAGSPGNESTYFGTKTTAALAKWQAANGVSPAAGYFGPITRAKINGMAGGTPSTPGGPVVVPSTGLSVSLSANNPRTGALVSSSGGTASRVPVLAFNVTAGTSGAATLTDLTFKKEGYIADSAISNAYLLEGGKVVAQYSSISSGMIKFTGMNVSVNAGQTRELVLGIDPASGLTAGNTVAISLMEVKAMDYANAMITPSGALPLMGNVFTVTSVSNPAIATLAVASSSVGTSVYAGTQNVLVSQWTMTGGNSPLNLKSINFKVVGSANKGDIKNVKLMVNGAQVGSVLPQVASDGSAFFSLGSTPAKLNTGANNVQVIADIMGSPSFNFQFELLNTYDIEALDSTYNVPVSPTITGGAGVQVSILQGTLTVNLASDTPTGNVIAGGSGTPLMKATIYAAGEPVKIKWLTFSLTFTGTLGATYDAEIKNLAITDDAGGQVGSTINSLVTSVTCTDGTFNAATSSAAVNCFGSSGSPINYIVPANTTRVLTLKGDVQSGAGFTTVVGALIASTNSNLQGVTSAQTANSGGVTGSALTRIASAVTVTQNTAIGTQTFAPGTQNARIGSYTMSASSAEGVNVSTLQITMSASGSQYQNLRVLVGGQQFATTYPTLSASTAYSFSGGLINIPAGQSKVVDVYADVKTSASGNHAAITTLSSCTGYGATSFTSVSCSSTGGQQVNIGGQPTLVVSNQTIVPPTQHLVANALNQPLAAWQFIETSNNEDVTLKEVYVFQSLPGVTGTSTASSSWTKTSFSNLRLVNLADNTEYSNGGTLYSNATNTLASSSPGYGYFYKFTLGNGLTVPKGQAGSVNLRLVGNVSDVVANGATDNGTHIFRIATSTPDSAIDTASEVVLAFGKYSAATSAITISSPVSNTSTVLRSKLTASAAGLGATSGRVKTGADRLATLTFTADAAGGRAVLNSVTITFAGTASAAGSSTATSTKLLDTQLLDVVGSITGAASSTTATSKTWTFGSGIGIDPGTSYTFTVELNSAAGTVAATGTNSVSLNLTVNAATDVAYSTAPPSSTPTESNGINLQATAVPIQLTTVTYAAGS